MQNIIDSLHSTSAKAFEWATVSLSVIPTNGEFWAAIIGAVVGGYISYLTQLRAIKETRAHRQEDRLLVQQGLANSLLFKVIRIHGDFYGIHRHIEECFERARKDGFQGEPWQIVLPLANFPDSVHFSPDEMGMLLGLKDDDVFNAVATLDVVHNSLVEAVRSLSVSRRALASELTPDRVSGNTLSGVMDRDTIMRLKPQMIEVNELIEAIRTSAKTDFEESDLAMQQLVLLFRNRLQIGIRLESKVKHDAQAEPVGSR
ncbi:MAG: hypothetical protein HXY30_09530 [Pseudorhodoplanes sp.]|nr:hypothetical protein [Pseudorhodoplanes sp.]